MKLPAAPISWMERQSAGRTTSMSAPSSGMVSPGLEELTLQKSYVTAPVQRAMAFVAQGAADVAERSDGDE
eukprot:1950811-Rhodomonas_salina.1